MQLARLGADGALAEIAAKVTYATAQDGAFQVTLVPDARLAYSQTYRLTLATALERARDKGRLPTTVHADFTTEDPPPLAVIFAKPSDQAATVSGRTDAQERTPTLIVRFSEPVDCASVAKDGNVVVTETYDPHPHTQTGSATSRVVPGAWKCNPPAADDPDRLEGTDCAKETDPEIRAPSASSPSSRPTRCRCCPGRRSSRWRSRAGRPRTSRFRACGRRAREASCRRA